MIVEEEQELNFEVMQHVSEDDFQAILSLESLFPEKIRDDKLRVRENFNNSRNIKIIMRENDSIVGYALAIPHNDALADLIEDDPLMEPDDYRYYIDKIAVISRLRKGTLFLRFVDAIFEEARKRDILNVSSHILCSNGLDKIISLMYRRRITKKRFTFLPSYGSSEFMYVDVKFG